jgi:hypothetical protein
MKIFIRLEYSPNVSMFCKQLAKSALIAEFKNGGH